MQNSWARIDVRAMADSLRKNLENFGGFSPEQIRKVGLPNEDALRHQILTALADGPATGHEIIKAISELKASPKPLSSQVYPLLENLADQGLISSQLKKDRKVYTLTEAGEKASKANPIEGEKTADTDSDTWMLPKWVDLSGKVPKAGARLASVLADVSKNGSKEQQEKAAAVIDEARKQIHQILASE